MSAPSQEFQQSALYLIDASSYIFRAYYAVRGELKAPDGTPTHATFGFLQMVASLLDEFKPNNCVFVWDTKEKGLRHDWFPAYKANRSAPPEDLGVQIDNTKKALELLGFPQLSKAGFEADDILATLVKKNPTQNTVIVTGDKDLLQLVSDHCWCLDTLKKQWSNTKETFEKFGVAPSQVVEVQALSGDSVDNVPGAPGIGPKTATELVQHFGSLNRILEEALARSTTTSYKDPLKGKRLEAIQSHAEQVRLSLKLVSLITDVPELPSVSELSRQPTQTEALLEFSKRLGFSKVLQRLGSGHGATALEIPEVLGGAPNDAPHVGQGTKPKGKTTLIRNVDHLQEVLLSASEASLFALDTETFGLERMGKNHLVGFSFSFHDEEGFYVPLRHNGLEAENLPVDPSLKVLERFLREHSDAGGSVVFQNAKFDLHAFASDGLASLAEFLRIEDTMVMSYVLDPSQKHGMDALSQKYLNGYTPIPFSEVVPPKKTFADVPTDLATQYAAEDAWVTFQLFHVLEQELKSGGVYAVYNELDRPLIPILYRMERAGVGIDLSSLHEQSKALHRELSELQAKAQASLRESGVDLPELNLLSPKQIATVLFEKLQLPVIKKGKTGPSTDVSVLEELQDKHPFVGILLEVREISKLLSTYIDALPTMLDSTTGRLHTDYSQIIAATGRLASSDPNLQNIPIRTERGLRVRNAFVAAPGKKFVSMDYSQVELRLLAGISRDPELLKAFSEGADIHKKTAALVLEKAEDEVTDADRRMAKAINFGIIYGQTAFGLSKSLGISRGEAQKFIDGYFKTYPGIAAYMKCTVESAKTSLAVKTLTGRQRFLRDIDSKNPTLRQLAERMAINSPIQGLAADLMKAAMIEVDRVLRREFPNAQLVLQVHDELVFELPANEVDALTRRISKIVEAPQIFFSMCSKDLGVHMKVDCGSGERWSDL